jgi:hypothetical protein
MNLTTEDPPSIISVKPGVSQGLSLATDKSDRYMLQNMYFPLSVMMPQVVFDLVDVIDIYLGSTLGTLNSAALLFHPVLPHPAMNSGQRPPSSRQGSMHAGTISITKYVQKVIEPFKGAHSPLLAAG